METRTTSGFEGTHLYFVIAQENHSAHPPLGVLLLSARYVSTRKVDRAIIAISRREVERYFHMYEYKYKHEYSKSENLYLILVGRRHRLRSPHGDLHNLLSTPLSAFELPDHECFNCFFSFSSIGFRNLSTPSIPNFIHFSFLPHKCAGCRTIPLSPRRQFQFHRHYGGGTRQSSDGDIQPSSPATQHAAVTFPNPTI